MPSAASVFLKVAVLWRRRRWPFLMRPNAVKRVPDGVWRHCRSDLGWDRKELSPWEGGVEVEVAAQQYSTGQHGECWEAESYRPSTAFGLGEFSCLRRRSSQIEEFCDSTMAEVAQSVSFFATYFTLCHEKFVTWMIFYLISVLLVACVFCVSFLTSQFYRGS